MRTFNFIRFALDKRPCGLCASVLRAHYGRGYKRILQGFVDDGLLTLERDYSPGKSRVYALTPKGRAVQLPPNYVQPYYDIRSADAKEQDTRLARIDWKIGKYISVRKTAESRNRFYNGIENCEKETFQRAFHGMWEVDVKSCFFQFAIRMWGGPHDNFVFDRKVQKSGCLFLNYKKETNDVRPLTEIKRQFQIVLQNKEIVQILNNPVWQWMRKWFPVTCKEVNKNRHCLYDILSKMEKKVFAKSLRRHDSAIFSKKGEAERFALGLKKRFGLLVRVKRIESDCFLRLEKNLKNTNNDGLCWYGEGLGIPNISDYNSNGKDKRCWGLDPPDI